MNEIILSETLPVLALRGITVFPGLVSHFDVGRPKSVRALEEAMAGNQEIFLIMQQDLTIHDPGLKAQSPIPNPQSPIPNPQYYIS